MTSILANLYRLNHLALDLDIQGLRVASHHSVILDLGLAAVLDLIAGLNLTAGLALIAGLARAALTVDFAPEALIEALIAGFVLVDLIAGFAQEALTAALDPAGFGN